MRRFFIVFLLAIAVPLLVVVIAVTVGYRRFSLDLAKSRAAQALAPLAEGIDEEIRQAALLTATLSTDRTFVASAVRLNESRGAREQYEAGGRIDERLSAFFNYTNKTGAALLYLRDLPVFMHRNNGFLFDRPLPKGAWYQTIISAPDATVILADLDTYSLAPTPRPLLKVAVCPSRDSFSRGFEALVVAFRVPFLDRVVSTQGERGEEELLLIDGTRRIILSSSPGRLGTRIDESLLAPVVFKRDGSTYVGSPASIPSAGWMLVSITDFSRVTRDIEALGSLARWLLLAALIGFAAYIEVFFRQVIRPITAVIAQMRKVEQGDWEVRVPEAGLAELAQLGHSFNTMVAEVKALTAERARLELEALRLQINPHFLTNTLNSIKMMAAISNAEPIRRMTAALMRVVSSSFRDRGSLAPVGEELQILEQYLLIMRVRYGDTFSASFDVPEDVRGLRVLRMLLQPLVENSILHGLQGIDRPGEIAISGRVQQAEDGGEALILEVRDNGCGMKGDRDHGPSSIGLANVRRRIVLNHGPSFGLAIDSEIDRGTVARLRLPLIRDG